MAILEKITANMELTELKKFKFQKSILGLMLEWKHLEEYMDSTQHSFQECLDQLQQKENHLNSVHESAMESYIELESVRDSIEGSMKQLGDKERLFNEQVSELGLKEKRLVLIEKSIEERVKEVELTEEKLNGIFEEFKVEEKRLEGIREAIGERMEAINSREVKLEEREKEFTAFRDEKVNELDLKEKRLALITKSVEERLEQVELREEKVKVMFEEFRVEEKRNENRQATELCPPLGLTDRISEGDQEETGADFVRKRTRSEKNAEGERVAKRTAPSASWEMTPEEADSMMKKLGEVPPLQGLDVSVRQGPKVKTNPSTEQLVERAGLSFSKLVTHTALSTFKAQAARETDRQFRQKLGQKVDQVKELTEVNKALLAPSEASKRDQQQAFEDLKAANNKNQELEQEKGHLAKKCNANASLKMGLTVEEKVIQKNPEESIKKTEQPPPPSRASVTPTVLVMKFPPGSYIPSVSELHVTFLRFWKVLSATVTRKTLTCRVVFRDRKNADAAYQFYNDRRIFGEAQVYLRDVELATSETTEQGKAQKEVEARPCPVTMTPGIQPKPILKKAGGEELGVGNSGNGGRETERQPRQDVHKMYMLGRRLGQPRSTYSRGEIGVDNGGNGGRET